MKTSLTGMKPAAARGRDASPFDAGIAGAAVSTTAGADLKQTGTIRRFGLEYGFIEPDDDGPDVFVHVRRLAGRRLEPGTRVEFTPRPDKAGRGFFACEVKLI